MGFHCRSRSNSFSWGTGCLVVGLYRFRFSVKKIVNINKLAIEFVAFELGGIPRLHPGKIAAAATELRRAALAADGGPGGVGLEGWGTMRLSC